MGPLDNSSSGQYGMGSIYASMGLSAFSSIVGAITQARAARIQGDYEASIARTNQSIAELQAREVLQAGDVAASRRNLKTQSEIGTLTAQQGASGISLTGGSGAIARSDAAAAGSTDELTIRNNAQRQAFGLQAEAIQSGYKAQFSQLTAKASSEQTLLSGGLKAVSGPLAIEANYLRFARYQGGTGAGSARLPFDLSTS